MKVSLFRHTIDPTLTIDSVASVCYDSVPSNEGKIMNHCYKSGHTSVLEFVDFIFYVEDVSRSLLAQLTRHRHASFAVRSQRYINESGFEVYLPDTIKNNKYVLNDYNQTKNSIGVFYDKAVSCGIPAEDARMMLPNACHTKLYVKFNLRSFINFCNERLCTRAQKEIRDLANAMKKLVVEIMPEAEVMLVPKCERIADYPFCTELKTCGKHLHISEVYVK